MQQQKWFEMRDVRGRRLDGSSWIPLRVNRVLCQRETYGNEGYLQDYWGLGSAAIPLASRSEASVLSWTDLGIGGHHSGYVDDDKYTPCDALEIPSAAEPGVYLVLDQRGNRVEAPEWHLNQDLVTTLRLKREGDNWVCLRRGYEAAARLHRNSDGSPCQVDVRAEYLKDYLGVRKMALLVSSYRDRDEIVVDASGIGWTDTTDTTAEGDRWEGRVSEIHEGGESFGSTWKVFHVSRTDVDPRLDVPVIGPPIGDGVSSESWSAGSTGRKLFHIRGELWRSEWIEPLAVSPIIRGERIGAEVSFISAAAGTHETPGRLIGSGKWLWFRPEVVNAVLGIRGSSLAWYTRDTGQLSCTPEEGVHFGMNSIGLVNVYAKDIALLADWQQRVWAAQNVAPEGGVSAELFASQVNADPAHTRAPEAELPFAIQDLAEAAQGRFAVELLHEHPDASRILSSIHRFRSLSRPSLLGLAKDVTRVTIDSLDVVELRRLSTVAAQKKLGSLKSLEQVLGRWLSTDSARKVMQPLVGVYELRHGDAHLPAKELEDSLALAGVDASTPFPRQGYTLLRNVVDAFFVIAKVIREERGESSIL